MMKLITVFLTTILMVFLVALISGCPGKLQATPPQVSHISNSEIAEAVVSGVVNATYQSGNMARFIPRSPRSATLAKLIESYLNPLPQAEAALGTALCPTLVSGNVGVIVPNASCVVGNNSIGLPNTLTTLTWAPCSLYAPFGTWSGGSNFSLITSPLNTQMTCTGFTPFQNGDIITRSFFSPTGRINNASLDPANDNPWNPLTQQDIQPVTVLVDTFGATQIPNGTAFTPAALQAVNYPPSAVTGYLYKVPSVGETITFSGPVARSISVNGLHIKADVAGYIVWDFTVSTANPAGVDSPISVLGTNAVHSGTIYIQDNLNLDFTQSTFTADLTYTAPCGVPSSGTVQTTQISGTPYATENLIFSATCAVATLNGNQFYLFHSF